MTSNRPYFLLAACVAAISVVASACSFRLDLGGEEGSGRIVTTEFDLENFDRITVGSSFEVDIVVDPQARHAVSVDTDDNLLDELDIAVDDGTLRVRVRSGANISPTRLSAQILVPRLVAIDASGASEVAVAGAMQADRVTIGASGASDVDVDVDADRVDVDVSGASDVEVGGATGDLDLGVSGASDLDADALAATSVTLRASGASTVRLRAVEGVAGQASGASSVFVDGGASVDVETSGASRVSSGAR